MTGSASAQLCGQLYCIRAEVARNIYLPKDLCACDDGFIKALVCTDFLTQAAATLAAPSAIGATNIKVSSIEGFEAGQKIMIDTGANSEAANIATVGTAGSTTVEGATDAGATVIRVANTTGLRDNETITIDSGANSETVVVASIRRFGGTAIVVRAPITHAHAAGVQVSGSGITLTAALTKTHAGGAQVSDNLPTPGAPNSYSRKRP